MDVGSVADASAAWCLSVLVLVQASVRRRDDGVAEPSSTVSGSPIVACHGRRPTMERSPEQWYDNGR